MKTFFTADTHFGSQRTLDFSRRPFNSVEEMDTVMIENWNNLVGKDDLVYHLGDFGDYSKLKDLPGRKILLFGNYERKDFPSVNEVEKREVYTRFQKEFKTEIIYDAVYNPNIYITCDNNKSFITLLSHEGRIGTPKLATSGTVNLFGHIHEKCKIKPYGLNVGQDCNNFAPIDMDTVTFYINAILNHYDEYVFY